MIRTLLLPSVFFAIMGAVVFGIYFGLQKAIGKEKFFFPVLISIIIGTLLYGILLLVLKGINENDLYNIPNGERFVIFLKKLHLL